MRPTILLVTAAALVTLIAGCPKPAEPPAPAPTSTNAVAAPVAPASTFSEGVTEADESAPAFTLKGTDGEPITSVEYVGKTLVLDFWATWCGPCVEKLQKYEPIMDKYRDKGVELVAVSLDSSPEVAAGWAKQNNSPFRMAMLDEKFQKAYFPEVTGQLAIPQVRIIDKDGNLRYRFDSKSTVEDLDLALSKLTADDNK
jgi:peroxiredoxin